MKMCVLKGRVIWARLEKEKRFEYGYSNSNLRFWNNKMSQYHKHDENKERKTKSSREKEVLNQYIWQKSACTKNFERIMCSAWSAGWDSVEVFRYLYTIHKNMLFTAHWR